MTRNTIDGGYLDDIFTPQEKVKQNPEVKKTEKLSLLMDAQLVERLKNAVYWSPGLTISSVVERATADMIKKLEKDNGKPFPERNGKMKKGRRIS